MPSSRGVPRDSMMLAATLRRGTETWPLRVRNLSAKGLMAELLAGMIDGDHVEIELRGVGVVAGRIVWIADTRFGVQFDRPIDPTLARKPVGASARSKMEIATSIKRPPVRTR